MTMRRRSLLTLSAAGAAGVGRSLLGTGPAGAAARAGAPTQRFAVGVRQYAWSCGSRRWTNYVYYPATGAPGGSPVADAPVAQGVFPVCEFMHGFSSSPQNSLAVIRPLAEAGFIVPAPHFANLSGQDVHNGNQSKDVSEIITRTLALSTAGDPLAGHINTAVGVGVSGHSMGGMTTHGLLTACSRPGRTRGSPPRSPCPVWTWATRARRSAPRPSSSTATGTERADLLRSSGVWGTARRQGVPHLPRRRPQQLFRRLPDHQHVRGLDAVEPLRRHRGPRPPSRRRHFLHHHLGIPPELRSNHARPGCARVCRDRRASGPRRVRGRPRTPARSAAAQSTVFVSRPTWTPPPEQQAAPAAPTRTDRSTWGSDTLKDAREESSWFH